MDRSEQLVKQHLESRGFTEIVFEPDGNVAPDFLVDGRIAVEVRRLNQNIETNGQVMGLEESSYPLFGKIESLLKSFGPPNLGTSWFVLHQFHRPIPDWPELQFKITNCCMDVREQSHLPPGTHLKAQIHENFELSFLKASDAHETQFLMGGYSDFDAGGLVLAEMEKNIQHCINVKTPKIAAQRSKYSEWWLALVDYIGYGLSQEDQDSFKSSHKLQHTWDKVLIISPQNPASGFEI
jgi:hypothetical protein